MYGNYGAETPLVAFLTDGIGSPPAQLDRNKLYVDKTVDPAAIYVVDTTVTPHVLIPVGSGEDSTTSTTTSTTTTTEAPTTTTPAP